MRIKVCAACQYAITKKNNIDWNFRERVLETFK